MVKELDLFESNHGCGLNALSQEKIRNGRNKTLHGPELVRNVFAGPFGAGRAIAHGFSMFEYFDLTGSGKGAFIGSSTGQHISSKRVQGGEPNFSCDLKPPYGGQHRTGAKPLATPKTT